MTEALAKPIDASALFQNFNVLDEFEHEVVRAIPELTDEQLIDGLTRAEALGQTAWRMRGAFGRELLGRAKKLNGGRGQKDQSGEGAEYLLAKAAQRAGVELRTIREDIRILNTFDTTVLEDTRLSRAHLRTAMYAPDPAAAIEIVAQKIDEPGFNTRQFEAIVRAQKTDATEAKREESAKLFYLDGIGISQKARKAMLFLLKHRDMKPNELFEQLLLDASEGRENQPGDWSKK